MRLWNSHRGEVDVMSRVKSGLPHNVEPAVCDAMRDALDRVGSKWGTVHPTTPLQVDYAATDTALELYESTQPLSGWAERHHEAITAARAAYDASTQTA
jgi:hypothetical protein